MSRRNRLLEEVINEPLSERDELVRDGHWLARVGLDQLLAAGAITAEAHGRAMAALWAVWKIAHDHDHVTEPPVPVGLAEAIATFAPTFNLADLEHAVHGVQRTAPMSEVARILPFARPPDDPEAA